MVIGGKGERAGKAMPGWGENDLLIAEADESDGSFLRLAPTIAAVTISIVSIWIITAAWSGSTTVSSNL